MTGHNGSEGQLKPKSVMMGRTSRALKDKTSLNANDNKENNPSSTKVMSSTTHEYTTTDLARWVVSNCTFRSGWSSTPDIDNKDAHTRPASTNLIGSSQFRWNAFLPQPTNSTTSFESCSSCFSSEDCVGDDGLDSSDNKEEIPLDDESFYTAKQPVDPDAPQTPPRTALPAVVKLADDDDDDCSEVSVEPEPMWSMIARRRSDARRSTLLSAKDEDVAQHLEDLITEKECAKSPARLDNVRHAAIAAIRKTSTQDLHSKVTSFDNKTGVFSIESKVKISGGKVVIMTVERVWADFILMRDDLRARACDDVEVQHLANSILGKIPRKRLRSVVRATAKNVLKGARTGELKWQQKQVGKLDDFLQTAIKFVTEVKNIATFHSNDWAAGFGRFEIEDYLLCFLCQGAFFTDVLRK